MNHDSLPLQAEGEQKDVNCRYAYNMREESHIPH